MEDRATQLRELVGSTKPQVDEISELFDSLHFGYTSALCSVTGEKLAAWWEGIIDATEKLLTGWPTEPGVHHVRDVYYNEALIAIDCRVKMARGALIAMQHGEIDVSSAGQVVVEEVWSDLVTRTEEFCEGRVLA